MPRDYSKTTIYKLCCNDLSITDVYVGHTTDFTRRKYDHSKNSTHSPYAVYECIRKNGGWKNWTMVLIEEFPCENDLQARARERYWYEQLNANLNMCRPLAYPEETITENRKKQIARNQKFASLNPNYWKEYRKKYMNTINDEQQTNTVEAL